MAKTRKWLPTLGELIDRLSIHQLKEVFIPENKENYGKEMKDMVHDIDLILKIKDLLHGKKFTIEGARSVFSGKSAPDLPSEKINKKIIKKLKNELNEILQIIKN